MEMAEIANAYICALSRINTANQWLINQLDYNHMIKMYFSSVL